MQSPPTPLSSTAELESSEEWETDGIKCSVLQSKLSAVLLISGAASSADVLCVSSSPPFSPSESQARK